MKKIFLVLITALTLLSCDFGYIDSINGTFNGDISDYYWISVGKPYPEKSSIIGIDNTYNPVVEIKTNTLGSNPIIAGDRFIVPELLLSDDNTYSNRIHILDNSLKLIKTLEIPDLEMGNTRYVINDSLVFLSASTEHSNGCKAAIIDINTYEIWGYWLNTWDAWYKSNAGVFNNTLYISEGPAGGPYSSYNIDDEDARMKMINLKTKNFSNTDIFHKEHPKDEADIVIDGNYLYMLFTRDRVLEKWNLATNTRISSIAIDDVVSLEPMVDENPILSEIWDYGARLVIIYFGGYTLDNEDGISELLIFKKDNLAYEKTVDFTKRIPPRPQLHTIKGNVAYFTDCGGIVNIETGEILKEPYTYDKLY